MVVAVQRSFPIYHAWLLPLLQTTSVFVSLEFYLAFFPFMLLVRRRARPAHAGAAGRAARDVFARA